jgi:ABC-2 type transport system ATP-binding protein
LLTTQYLDEADELADEITVIDHGRVIARGTSSALKQQVGGDRLEITIVDPGQAGRVAETLAARSCGEIVVAPDRRTITVPVVQLDGMVPTAVRDLDRAGIAVNDVAARHATLDDVFFALTGRPAEVVDDPDGPDAPTAPEKVSAR